MTYLCTFLLMTLASIIANIIIYRRYSKKYNNAIQEIDARKATADEIIKHGIIRKEDDELIMFLINENKVTLSNLVVNDLKNFVKTLCEQISMMGIFYDHKILRKTLKNVLDKYEEKIKKGMLI